jgi:DNA helicase-2/ATP-dependent DNA helicase PcrA
MEIVVLARNKYLFKSLEEALQAANIPHYYKMTPGALKFESSLMQIFDLALRVELNSQDELHTKRLLNALSLNNREDRGLSKIVTNIHDDQCHRVLKLMQRLIIGCLGVVMPMNKQFINISEQHILFIIIGNGYTMKGQEFDIVFIIGMDDETFPDYRAVRSGGVELTQEKDI